MDKKIKMMDKAKVLYELERLTNLSKLSKEKIDSLPKEKKKADKSIKPKVKPDYNIFEKPKKARLTDYFSIEFMDELKDNLGDKKASKCLIKIIKGKGNESDSSSSSDEE
jgi:hypothetical protein